jgi:hypothetical protein
MSAYRKKQKLFSKVGTSLSLRGNTPENGFRFKRDIPPIGYSANRVVRSAVASYPQLSEKDQTDMVYRAMYPELPREIDINSPAPSMQKAVNTWHAIHNWIVYYRHHPEETHG